MRSEIFDIDGVKHVRYSNGFFKKRVELLQTCLTETNNRILAFQRIRPELESYLLKRIGGPVVLELDGSIKEGTCNKDSDIDLRILLPHTNHFESQENKIKAIVKFYDEYETGQVKDLNIDLPYRLHFLRNI